MAPQIPQLPRMPPSPAVHPDSLLNSLQQAKKKLKAVTRAIRSARNTPSTLKGTLPATRTPQNHAPVFDLLRRQQQDSSDEEEAHSSSGATSPKAPAIPIPRPVATENSRLAEEHGAREGLTRYGSIIGTPPELTTHDGEQLDRAPSLRLPGPAISSGQSGRHENDDPAARPNATSTSPTQSLRLRDGSNGASKKDNQGLGPQRRLRDSPQLQRSSSMPAHPSPHKQSLVSRMLTFRTRRNVTFDTSEEMPMEAYQDIEDRQNDFFAYLDEQLKTVDDFYKEKEDEATKRLQVLREQLHIMRDRRMEEVMRGHHQDALATATATATATAMAHDPAQNGDRKSSKSKISEPPWLHPLDKAVDKAKRGHVGKTFQAMKELGTPSGPSAVDLYRDYTTKPASKDVPYRTAKYKLKIALAEHYRGLELLKSYALLNRTAFRKITKKYDKMFTHSPGSKYMSEKVSTAYFVKSEVIDGHIHAVEDLYARYFERGNHKVAVSKLRAKIAKAGEFSACSFVNGILLALGAALALEGLVYAGNDLSSADAGLVTQTQFLLQLYGGFFLAILLALFFCLACRLWHRSKVNYTFVFEFDTRRQILDWRQLAQVRHASTASRRPLTPADT